MANVPNAASRLVGRGSSEAEHEQPDDDGAQDVEQRDRKHGRGLDGDRQRQLVNSERAATVKHQAQQRTITGDLEQALPLPTGKRHQHADEGAEQQAPERELGAGDGRGLHQHRRGRVHHHPSDDAGVGAAVRRRNGDIGPGHSADSATAPTRPKMPDSPLTTAVGTESSVPSSLNQSVAATTDSRLPAMPG